MLPRNILHHYTDHNVPRLSDHVPLAKDVSLGPADTLKIIITATENGAAKRPHQAFLLLRDQDTGLETTFPFSVKDSGKGKVDFVCALAQLDVLQHNS